ncbi:synaptic vesicle glycoprotein 2B-like isoform X1 [Ostrinia nubilalis]|uniref:synaptic vesicle glycoprotein 2B-like isoform X1 n=1 Tax=Ostrinia nubilalis TaxID=29057 RepID=UPI0030823002
MDFEIFSVGYLVPTSACELGTTSAQQGLMAATPVVGIIATSHIWGYLADTRGRKKVLCFSMTLSFVASTAAAFAPDWITFSVFKLISSTSVAGAFALAFTLLSECNPEAKRAFLLILTSTIFLCSSGIMAVIALPVLPLKFSYYIPALGIHFNSWRLLNLIYGFPSAISAFGLLFALESPKFFLSVGQEDKALDVLRTMFVINNRKSGDEYPIKSLALNEEEAPTGLTGLWSSIVAQTIPLFKPPLLKKTVLMSVIFVITYLSINPYVMWMPYIVDGFMRSVRRGEANLTFCERIRATHHLSHMDQLENQCAMNEFAMTMVFGIGVILAIGNTIATVLVNYVKKKTMLIVIQIMAGVSGILLNSTSLWFLSAGLFLMFVAGTINFGFLSTFTVEIFPTYVKAMAVSLTLMMGRSSAVAGINVLKELLNTNCEASFYVFGSVTLVGAGFYFLLPAEASPVKTASKNRQTVP